MHVLQTTNNNEERGRPTIKSLNWNALSGIINRGVVPASQPRQLGGQSLKVTFNRTPHITPYLIVGDKMEFNLLELEKLLPKQTDLKTIVDGYTWILTISSNTRAIEWTAKLCLKKMVIFGKPITT